VPPRVEYSLTELGALFVIIPIAFRFAGLR
jgi:DNA-binding HxlR family transcriptional regulator